MVSERPKGKQEGVASGAAAVKIRGQEKELVIDNGTVVL
jgi:hypothetical protein